MNRTTQTHDVDGRPWAKLSEVQPGAVVEVDGGFDCMSKGDIKRVQEDNDGRYVLCTHGRHYLNGQADDGEHCVGIYGDVV